MKIYLAGPMTGLADYNFPAFNAMAYRLRALGHEVNNPAEYFGGNQQLPYHMYMRAAAKAVPDCDAVAVLAGWNESKGARFEVLIADTCKIPVLNAAVLCRSMECAHFKESAEEYRDVTRLHVPLTLGLAVGAMLAAALLVFCAGCETALPRVNLPKHLDELGK